MSSRPPQKPPVRQQPAARPAARTNPTAEPPLPVGAAPKSRRRPRLLWTLLGALILVSVIPLLLSHYFLIGINRDSLETLEKKYLTRSAVSIAADTQNFVSNYTQQLMKIGSGISASTKFLPPDKTAIQYAAESGIISTHTSSDPDLLALRVMDINGQGTGAQPAGLSPGTTREMNAVAAEALKGKSRVGTFQNVEVVNQPAIVIAVPVLDPEGRTIGAIQALVSLRRISERLREEGKGEVAAFVVDGTGRVLMHSEASINVQRPDFSRLKIVQEFMKAPVRITESYEDTVTGGNRRVLGTVAPVGNPNWGVVVQKEEARAFASVQKMVRRTIEFSAIALGLAIIVATFFATGISRPVRALVQRTREIAEGNYQQRADIVSKNEIGELAENFNVMSSEIEKSVEQLKKAANENQLLFINSVRMLAAAIDAKDPYTRGHSERVARFSIAIGKHLALPADQMRNLRISALLHDVGKIGIDDRILRKPGALSDEEFDVMKTHPDKGAAIMSGVAQLIDIIPGMKYHHEKWAGGGYPDGLVAEKIPMQARIVAVADTFDAMTTNRPYQKAMELKYVVDKISSFAGSRFDPQVVDAFVRAVESGDIQVEDQVRGAA